MSKKKNKAPEPVPATLAFWEKRRDSVWMNIPLFCGIFMGIFGAIDALMSSFEWKSYFLDWLERLHLVMLGAASGTLIGFIAGLLFALVFWLGALFSTKKKFPFSFPC